MQQPVLSGGQSLIWDAPLMLKALAYKGIPIRHEVHSVDQFSRSATTITQPATHREWSHSDGQKSLWSSGMKSVPFLGRLTANRRELVKAVHPSVPLSESTYEALFTSDVAGVVIPNGNRAIHGVPFSEVRGQFSHLRSSIKANLRKTIVEGSLHEAQWERMFNFMQSPSPILPDELSRISVGAMWARMLPAWLGGYAASVAITTSFENLSQMNFAKHGFLETFLGRYHDIAGLYNHVSADCGMNEINASAGELPYFTICGKTWQRDAVRKENVHALPKGSGPFPKAIPLLIELLLRSRVAMPEQGSLYSGAVVKLVRMLNQELGCGIRCHPIMRVKFNALDNMAGLGFRFRLPQYLHSHFGTEIITADDFARTWRSVADKAEANLNRFLTMWRHEREDCLVGVGRIQSSTYACYAEIQAELRRGQGHAPDNDIYQGMAQAFKTKVQERALQYAIELWQVSHSLRYWNDRPYAWWMLVDPSGSWERNIISRAEVYEESMQ